MNGHGKISLPISPVLPFANFVILERYGSGCNCIHDEISSDIYSGVLSINLSVLTMVDEKDVLAYGCRFEDKLPGHPGLFVGRKKFKLVYPLPESMCRWTLKGRTIKLTSEQPIPDEFTVKFTASDSLGQILAAKSTVSSPFEHCAVFDVHYYYRLDASPLGDPLDFTLQFFWKLEIPNIQTSTMWKLAFEEQLCADIKLVARNGEHIMASKIVLSVHSDVFRAMLGGRSWEPNKSEVDLDDDYEPLFQLVNYIYDRTFNPTSVNEGLRLLMIADKYNIPSAKAQCVAFLGGHVITDSNVMDIFQVSHLVDAHVLSVACIRFLIPKTDPEFENVPGWGEFNDTILLSRLDHHKQRVRRKLGL